MLENLKKLILSKYLTSLIRTLMVMLGTWLIAKGINQEVVGSFVSASTELLVALATILLAQLWSWIEKRGMLKKIGALEAILSIK